MPPPDRNNQPIPKTKLTLNFVWAQMLASVGLYELVGWLVTNGGRAKSLPAQPTMLYALAFAAFASIAGSHVYENRMLDPERLMKKETRAAAYAELMTQSIFTMAFIEAAAIFGLVWVFMSMKIDVLPYFLCAAGAALVLLRIRLNGLFEKLDANHRWLE